jgi:hypothetical protein
LPDSGTESGAGTYHCPSCRSGYDGYHRCPDGPDRVEHECIDCGEHVNRQAHDMDIEGIAPKRCFSCTLGAMAE